MKKTWISSAHQGYVTEGMRSNTLSAFLLAAKKGADMIETDVRMTRDGVLIANHDPILRGMNETGSAVEYEICGTDASVITSTILAPNDPLGVQYVPTLEQILHLAYHQGLQVNLDLKEGAMHAEETARIVRNMGMRGRVVYATNRAGADTIRDILRIDPAARFIDRPENFTKKALCSISDYPARCYAYTSDFSEKNIAAIRDSGCMLAVISLNESTIKDAFRWHPDMAEYPHTSDFAKLDGIIMNMNDPERNV